MQQEKPKTGYDKYIDWKIFSIPAALLLILLLIPTPYGMKDVGMEYKIGTPKVIEHLTQKLFGRESCDADQWELITAQMMEQNMRIGASSSGSAF